MRVSVLLEDGEVLGGESGAGSVSPLGYPLIPDGPGHEQPDWIPLDAIRYVVLPGPPAPGLDDPREARGCQKVILRFSDGVVVRTYRDETFGIVGESIRALRWDPVEQRFERLLVPSQNLKGIFNVNSWEAGLEPVVGTLQRIDSMYPDVRETGDVKASLVGALVSRLRLALSEIDDVRLASHDELALQAAIAGHLDALLGATGVQVTVDLRAAVLKMLIDDAVGYGALDPLLSDAQVTEIMVNAPGEIFIEKDGIVSRAPAAFKDEAELVRVVQRMVSRTGRRIDHASPIVDTRLADGSRLNAVMPPASLRGTTLTIRKFSTVCNNLDDMVSAGIMSAAVARVLDTAVRSSCSILVSGATGAGKTTLLNILASRIPDSQRIITIEDIPEVQIHHQNLVSLECQDTNVEGKGRLTIRDLLRNALRMRPDRIIIGEVRGVEAFDMVQAMNTGHDGGMSTIHANSPTDAISRLESLALSGSPGLTLEAIRRQIVSALDLLVHLVRLDDGRRRVAVLAELAVNPLGTLVVQPRFTFEDGRDSVQVFPVEDSKLVAKIVEHGFDIPPELIAHGG